jgi:hypothetical protein
MLSVADYLGKATEHERLSNEAKRSSQKIHSANMAKCYRFLAEQQAMIDEQLTV